METLYRRRHRPEKFLEGFLGQDPYEDYSISRTGLNVPAINIAENESQWLIELGAPGLCSDNYKISVQDDVLNIEASKQMNTPDTEKKYSHREFIYNDFNKSFTLPQGADVSKISASCKDGLLNVVIPKKEEQKLEKPRKIRIS